MELAATLLLHAATVAAGKYNHQLDLRGRHFAPETNFSGSGNVPIGVCADRREDSTSATLRATNAAIALNSFPVITLTFNCIITVGTSEESGKVAKDVIVEYFMIINVTSNGDLTCEPITFYVTDSTDNYQALVESKVKLPNDADGRYLVYFSNNSSSQGDEITMIVIESKSENPFAVTFSQIHTENGTDVYVTVKFKFDMGKLRLGLNSANSTFLEILYQTPFQVVLHNVSTGIYEIYVQPMEEPFHANCYCGGDGDNCYLCGNLATGQWYSVEYPRHLHTNYREADSSLQTLGENAAQNMIAIAISTAAVFGFALAVSVYYAKRLKTAKHLSTASLNDSEAEDTISRRKVRKSRIQDMDYLFGGGSPSILVLYAEDHSLHGKIVVSFANMLRTFGACNVIFDKWCDAETVLINDWLPKQLRDADKVIIIVSEGVKELRDTFETGKFFPRYTEKYPCSEHVIDTLVFARTFPWLRKKMLFVKFPYTSDGCVAEIKSLVELECFNFPESMHLLVSALHGALSPASWSCRRYFEISAELKDVEKLIQQTQRKMSCQWRHFANRYGPAKERLDSAVGKSLSMPFASASAGGETEAYTVLESETINAFRQPTNIATQEKLRTDNTGLQPPEVSSDLFYEVLSAQPCLRSHTRDSAAADTLLRSYSCNYALVVASDGQLPEESDNVSVVERASHWASASARVNWCSSDAETLSSCDRTTVRSIEIASHSND